MHYVCDTSDRSITKQRVRLSKIITDSEIIEALNGPKGKALNQATDALYHSAFASIKAYILKNSGTEEEADDLFQDALVILYMRIRKGAFESKSSLNTYLYAVAKNLWLKQLRKKGGQASSLPPFDEVAHPEELVLQQNQVTIRQVLALIDKDCRQLLMNFYFDRMSFKQIQAQFGLGSEAAAKNKKYRCLRKVVDLVKERKWGRADFTND